MSLKVSDEIRDKIDKSKEVQKTLLGRLRHAGFDVSKRVGQEGEYDIRGLIGGIDALLTDLGGILRKQGRLAQLTNYSERSAINQHLGSLWECINQTDVVLTGFTGSGFQVIDSGALQYQNTSGQKLTLPLADAYQYVDLLKPALRNLNIRQDPDRLDELFTRLDELQRYSTNSESYYEQIKLIHSQIESIEQEIQGYKTKVNQTLTEIEGKSTKLDEKAKELEDGQSSVAKLHNSAVTTLSTINQTASEVEKLKANIVSHEGVVNKFVEQISTREMQLDEQAEKTKQYEANLEAFSKERESLIAQGRKLIEEAQNALNLSGTVALGRHFKDQYEEAKAYHWAWLVAGAVFFACAFGIGIWLLLDRREFNSNAFILGRISLIPLAIGGAWFCASQYTKQKRIIEDYAYKKVLALSLISFRGELESEQVPEHIKSYLDTVLKEIHRYPLEAINPSKPDKEDASALELSTKEFMDILKEFVKKMPVRPEDKPPI